MRSLLLLGIPELDHDDAGLPARFRAPRLFKGGGGKGGKVKAPPPPAPIPPPPPPTVEDASVKAEQEANRDRLRRGRAATILTSGGDQQATVSSAASQLLGS